MFMDVVSLGIDLHAEPVVMLVLRGIEWQEGARKVVRDV
jgi:hypothetical protein